MCKPPSRALQPARRSFWQRFRHDASGNIVVMFGLVMLPMLWLIGAAIDYSRAMSVKSEAQATLDAAVLAGGKRVNIDSNADVEQTVRSFVEENAKDFNLDGSVTVDEVVIDSTEGRIHAAATASAPASFMKLLGFEQISFDLAADAVVGNRSFEVALVLDNSGSMAGQRIADLRTAAGSLTDILFGDKPVHPKMSIGVVPFAGLVNVGTDNADASWMDTDGKSSIHKATFVGSKTRFEIYNDMNVDWLGCVEARPAPYDTDDSEPGEHDKDTLFVPSFAPDEPDGNFHYLNSYLTDNGGSCHGADVTSDACSNPSSAACEVRQKKTCKYEGATANISRAHGTRMGPNWLCDSSPITPISNVKSEVESAFSGMQAYGGTNIHEGVAWGWRVLSPSEPFTEGKAYDTRDNAKVIVLMTDGHNDVLDTITHTRSAYHAYGFYTDNRLDTGGDNSDEAMEQAINVKTLATCSNAKAAGIQIYTIAFGVDDEPTIDMLRSCASSPGMAFQSSTGSNLIATFQQIAQQINTLRLAK